MSTIGSVVLKLEAQHAGMTEGLNQGRRSIIEFKGAEEGFGKKLREGLEIGAGVELARKGLETISETIHRVIDVVKESIQQNIASATQTRRTAESLHLHTETLGAMQIMARKAGLDTEQLAESLEKLNAKIGQAASEGGAAAEVFGRLGLSARALAGQGMEASIRQIADALARVPNSAERAAIAAELFGERMGPKLVAALGQGQAGIDRMIEEGEKLGTILSSADTAQLTAAGAVLREIGETLEGLKTRLAVDLAPYITALGEAVLKLAPDARAVSASVSAGIEQVIFSLAALWDKIDAAGGVMAIAADAGKPWLWLFRSTEDAALMLGGALVLLGQAFVDFGDDVTLGLVGPVARARAELDSLQDRMSAMRQSLADAQARDNAAPQPKPISSHHAADAAIAIDALHRQADAAAEALEHAIDAAPGAVADGAAASAKKATDLLLGLNGRLLEVRSAAAGVPKEILDLQNLHAGADQIMLAQKLLRDIEQVKIHVQVDAGLHELMAELETFGMSAGQKKLFDLKAMGASPEEIATAQAYLTALEDLEKQQKKQEQANQITQQMLDADPLQKYASEMEKLERLHDEGLLSAQVYAAGVAKANHELGESMKALEPPKHAAAQTRRHDFAGPAAEPRHADPMAELTRSAKQQQQDVAQSKFYLQEIYRYQMNQDQNQDQTVDFTD